MDSILEDKKPEELTEAIVMPKKKKKILFISDHQLAPSGIGVQARFLIEGLVRTGKYSFRCLGGAMKHNDYNVTVVNSDFVIKPVDGFGTREQVRNILMTERPDAILIFTDPRQFIWLWEIEDEIHQLCPITYWHVWDNDPYPSFNKVWYESTDLINCLSYKTYEMVKPNFPEKTNYIPHAFPKEVYFPAPEDQVAQIRKQNFGDKADWFMALWVNRNATRKMPSDILEGWKLFLDKLEKEFGHKKACLVMHTDPNDNEGPNLLMVSEYLGLSGNVLFSTNKLDFNHMNVLHNITDTTINIAKNEGFSLSSLITLQCGKPVINLKTGGLTRQVVDYRDGTQHGVGIEPVTRKMVGSQMVPYIYEDFAAQEDVANAFMKIYKITPEEKRVMKEKTTSYVAHEFGFEKMVADWDLTLMNAIETFQVNKPTKKNWQLTLIDPKIEVVEQVSPNKLTDDKVTKMLKEQDKKEDPLKKIHSSILKNIMLKNEGMKL